MIRIAAAVLVIALEMVPCGEAFLRQLQQRDSILVADQVEYGFELDSVVRGTSLALQDFSQASNDTLTLVRGWQVDTLKSGRKRNAEGPFKIRGSIVLAPFEEGEYHLPELLVARNIGGKTDTLVFSPQVMTVKTMPVDTASFVIHDIKGQIEYPVTFVEVLPYIIGALALAALIILAVWLIRRRKARREELAHKDPPHIIALRELDKFRSDKYWAPEKQKAFYSGITDALKNYMDARFGVDAPEMTTAELFAALKSEKELTPELFDEMKDLFERADFVKFAKFVASEQENASALPAAVRFVTSTYQTEIEEESNVL